MTEHILNFSIALDDEGIRKSVQEKAVNEIIKDIKRDILNKIFTSKYYNVKPTQINRNGNIELKSDAILATSSEQIIKELFNEHKEEIIDKAAQLLCESLKRTKVVKEATINVLKD